MLSRRITDLPNGIDRDILEQATHDIILSCVEEYTDNSITMAATKSKKRVYVEPLHLARYFLTITQLSLTRIGELTRCDHATVIHSRKQVEGWMQTDKHFRVKIYALATLIITNYQKSKLCEYLSATTAENWAK